MAKILTNGETIRVNRTMKYEEVQMFFTQNKIDDLRNWKGGNFNQTWTTNEGRSLVMIQKIQ